MDTNKLRQKILDMAIRGKLVPQDPNDEPASVLLERIRNEKQRMVQDGKLKKRDIKNDTIIFRGDDNLHYEKFQDGSVKCIEDEIPFEVPEGWAWCRLKHVCTMAAGKAKPTDQIMTEPFEGCYPCFGGNGIRGYVDEYNQDGIFSIVGRQGALCGNINIAKGKFYATEHAVVTTLFSGIDFNWSNYVLEALQLNSYATGAAQPGLSVANVLNVFVPVPPTQEQVHIGIRIAEFIKIIENIEDEKENLQTLISSAKSKILDLAIRGKLVPQNPNDEPASVLLERIRAEKEELIKAGKIKRDKKESIIFRGEDKIFGENFEVLPLGIGKNAYRMQEDILFCKEKGNANSTFNELVVMFPFLSESVIADFNLTDRALSDCKRTLITRRSELGKLKASDVDNFTIYALKDEIIDGEDEISDELADKKKQDIHAKIYLRRKYSDVDLYLGSMNASYSAINKNVEMMLWLGTKNMYLNGNKFLEDIFCGPAGDVKIHLKKLQ